MFESATSGKQGPRVADADTGKIVGTARSTLVSNETLWSEQRASLGATIFRKPMLYPLSYEGVRWTSEGVRWTS
jgi:hypothetical protein